LVIQSLKGLVIALIAYIMVDGAAHDTQHTTLRPTESRDWVCDAIAIRYYSWQCSAVKARRFCRRWVPTTYT